MTSDFWTFPGSGFFHISSNWSAGVPGPSDDAILGVVGSSPYTVTIAHGPGLEVTVNSIQTAATETLWIAGVVGSPYPASLTATSGTGGGVNAGVIRLEGTSGLQLGGIFDNTGLVESDASGEAHIFVGYDQALDMTFSGGGRISAFSPIVPIGLPDVILTNIDNTITDGGGIGDFFGPGTLDFVNEANGVVVCPTTSNNPIAFLTVGLTNAGLIKSVASTGEEFDVAGPMANSGTINNLTGTVTFRTGDASALTITNTGLIEGAGSGSLLFYNDVIQNAGGTILAAGGPATLQGADIVGGTLKSTGSNGAVHVSTGVNILDGASSAVTLGGKIVVADGHGLRIRGSIVNGGALYLKSTGTATTLTIGDAGVTFSGGGQIVLSASSQNLIVGAIASATLTNANNKITGAGDIGDGSMSLVNQAGGVINANTAALMTLDTGANTIVNAGVIETTGTGGLAVAGALANNGVLQAARGSLTVGGAVTGTGHAVIGAGTLSFVSSFSESVTFSGAGGVLALAQSQTYGGKIGGFSKTGATSLDLGDITFTEGTTTASYAGNANGGVLTVTDGTHTANIHFFGDYTASSWTLSSDGHGGTTVVDPKAASLRVFIQATAGMTPAAAASPGADADAWRSAPTTLALALPAHTHGGAAVRL